MPFERTSTDTVEEVRLPPGGSFVLADESGNAILRVSADGAVKVNGATVSGEAPTASDVTVAPGLPGDPANVQAALEGLAAGADAGTAYIGPVEYLRVPISAAQFKATDEASATGHEVVQLLAPVAGQAIIPVQVIPVFDPGTVAYADEEGFGAGNVGYNNAGGLVPLCSWTWDSFNFTNAIPGNIGSAQMAAGFADYPIAINKGLQYWQDRAWTLGNGTGALLITFRRYSPTGSLS